MKAYGKEKIAVQICALLLFLFLLTSGVRVYAQDERGSASWVSDETGVRYVYEDGSYDTDTLMKIGSYWYYFNEQGYRAKGWTTIGEDRYYFWYQTGAMRTGWAEINGHRYYLDPSTGKMARGWKKIGAYTYYFDASGAAVQGWQTIDGGRYYFWYATNVLRTGLMESGNDTYYLQPSDGQSVSGWQKINGKTYYFDAGGKAVKGWQTIDGNRYYFWYGTRAMCTGFMKDANKNIFYFFPDSGKQASGWQKIQNYSYYFETIRNGAAAKGWRNIEGRQYYFWYEYGRMATGWLNQNGRRYYQDPSTGARVQGWKTIQGETYYFWYNVGYAATGVHNISGKTWYMDNSGRVVKNGWFSVGNTKWYLKNGAPVKNQWVGQTFLTKDGRAGEPAHITRQQLDALNLSGTNKLMIVAHPDDEILWGGAKLMEDNYLVVCLTNGYNSRKDRFQKALQQTGDKGIVLEYPDLVDGVKSDWSYCKNKIAEDLRTVLMYKNWSMIVTHNPSGEYGHIHHSMTSQAVSTVCRQNSLMGKLYYFGRYYSTEELPKHAGSLQKVSSAAYSRLVNIFQTIYSGYAKAFLHMLPYENWIYGNSW